MEPSGHFVDESVTPFPEEDEFDVFIEADEEDDQNFNGSGGEQESCSAHLEESKTAGGTDHSQEKPESAERVSEDVIVDDASRQSPTEATGHHETDLHVSGFTVAKLHGARGAHHVEDGNERVLTSDTVPSPVPNRGQNKLAKLAALTGRSTATKSETESSTPGSLNRRGQQKLAKLQVTRGAHHVEDGDERVVTSNIPSPNRGQNKLAKLAALTRRSATATSQRESCTAGSRDGRGQQKLAKLHVARRIQHVEDENERVVANDTPILNRGQNKLVKLAAATGRSNEPRAIGELVSQPAPMNEVVPAIGAGLSAQSPDVHSSHEEPEYHETTIPSPPPSSWVPDSSLPEIRTQEEHLPQASRVDEQTSIRNLPLAVEVDGIDGKSPKRCSRCNWVLVAIGLIVLVGVVLAVIFATNANRERGDTPALLVSSTISPTSSASPSIAPSLSPAGLVLSLLPNFTRAELLKEESPQSRALKFLLEEDDEFLSLSGLPEERILQRFVLATLFFATQGDKEVWQSSNNWVAVGEDECSWWTRDSLFLPGTTGNRAEDQCNENGTLQNLWLWGNDLQGSLPPELCLLTSLKSINLDGQAKDESFGSMDGLEISSIESNVGGTIPTEVGLCTSLVELSLSTNAFTGSLPTELGLLSSLRYLGIEEVLRMDGFIPSELGQLTGLTSLKLSLAGIEGKIPPELGRLSQLQEIDLSHNWGMSGTVPSEIGLISLLSSLSLEDCWSITGHIPTHIGLMTSLVLINFAGSVISGPVPSEIGRLTALSSLKLRRTMLTALPTEMGLLYDLVELDLSTKSLIELTGSFPVGLLQLTELTRLGLSFQGTIPFEISQLSNLVSLEFPGKITGVLPSSIGDLTKLTNLDMSGNTLTGTLPTQLGNMLQMVELTFKGNLLTGSIPSELGLSSLLQALDLGSSLLSGNIPSEIASLQRLLWLRLGSNALTGSIPSVLGVMGALEALDLRENSLEGSIPTELGLLEALRYLDLEKNYFGARIPADLGLLTALFYLSLADNGLTGVIPTELGQIAFSPTALLCGGTMALDIGVTPACGTYTSTTMLSTVLFPVNWVSLRACLKCHSRAIL